MSEYNEKSLSAQEYIEEQIDRDLDCTAYQITSGLEDLFAMMIHLYHNEPELFDRYMEVWKETEAKVFELKSRLSEATEVVSNRNKLRQRRMYNALAGGIL